MWNVHSTLAAELTEYHGYIHEPWTMSVDLQHKVGCLIGEDYPKPIVDHAEARKWALTAYGKVS
jgi:deoxyribodipyrimidine photo-lyase